MVMISKQMHQLFVAKVGDGEPYAFRDEQLFLDGLKNLAVAKGYGGIRVERNEVNGTDLVEVFVGVIPQPIASYTRMDRLLNSGRIE